MSLIKEETYQDVLGSGGTRKRFINNKTHQAYRRICGGLAFPAGARPGFVVVVAEDFMEDVTLNARHLRVLAEFESTVAKDLFAHCSDLTPQLKVQDWYGNPRNAAMMALLSKFNERSRVKAIYLNEAPFAHDPNALSFYSSLIQEKAQASRSLLHIGTETRLKNHLLEFSPEDAGGKNVEDFPAIFALGACVASLDHEPIDSYEFEDLRREFIRQREDLF